MKMSSATRFAAAVWVMSSAFLLAGCERSSEPEKATVKAAAEATPTTVPATAAPLVIDAQVEKGDQPFEDDLVLLAEGDPDWGEAPLTVKFSVESLIMDQMNDPRFTWDFGDGSPEAHEGQPVHTYDKPGNYDVTIKIVDATGETGWDELDVEVVEPTQKQKEAGSAKP
jgi:PKD repeat protein